MSGFRFVSEYICGSKSGHKGRLMKKREPAIGETEQQQTLLVRIVSEVVKEQEATTIQSMAQALLRRENEQSGPRAT